MFLLKLLRLIVIVMMMVNVSLNVNTVKNNVNKNSKFKLFTSKYMCNLVLAEDDDLEDEDLGDDTDLEDDTTDTEDEDVGSSDEEATTEDETAGNNEEENLNAVVVEPVQIDKLGFPPNYDKNPFQVLLKPPTPIKQEEPQIPVEEEPKQVEIPPLNVKLLGAITSKEKKIALLQFNGQVYELAEGDSVPGMFQVVTITDNQVVIFDLRLKKRQILTYEE